MMMDWLTDKRFLVGAAAGYLVLPYAVKLVTMQLSRLRGGGQAA